MWIHNASPEAIEVSNYPTIIAVCILVTALMISVVSLRVYARARIVNNIGLDDYIIIITAIFAIIYNALTIAQTRWGLGLPLALRPKVNINSYSEVNFAGRPFYQLGIAGFKASFLYALLRITRAAHSPFISRFRRCVWAALAIIIIGHIAGTLVLIFQCSPVRKSWRPLTHGTCLPNDVTFYALAGFSIACDLIAILLPLPLLASLQMNKRRRYGLIAPFLLGFFTTLCSVMRLYQITIISRDGNSTMLVLWGTIEFNVGIISACLPTLVPVIKYFRNRDRSNNSNPKTSSRSTWSNPATRFLHKKVDKYREVEPNHGDIRLGNVRSHAEGGSQADSVAWSKNGEERGIVRTTDVRVEREVRSASETEFGMRDEMRLWDGRS